MAVVAVVAVVALPLGLPRIVSTLLISITTTTAGQQAMMNRKSLVYDCGLRKALSAMGCPTTPQICLVVVEQNVTHEIEKCVLL